MLKVLLVDDEVYVRKGLRELIPEEKLGLVIAGEAGNGKEALEMIGELKPDLVITDIRMPILDGLGLIRSVNECTGQNPDFIIISGYHDFEYAQQALRYGVHDYILKPVDEEEMIATLRKLCKKKDENRMVRLFHNEWASSSILEALAEQELASSEAKSYIEALGMAEASGYKWVIAEIYDEFAQGRASLKQVQECVKTVANWMEEVPVMERQPGQFGLLFSTNGMQEADGTRVFLERLQKTLSSAFNAETGVFSGDSVTRIEEIRQSHRGALEAARHKFAESGGVVSYADVQSRPLYVFDMNPDISSRLTTQVEEGSRAAYRATIDSMFQLFREQRFAPGAVMNSLFRCLNELMRIIKEMGGAEEEPSAIKELLLREHANWGPALLKEHFVHAVLEAEDCIEKLRKEQSSGCILQIKQYIDAHYYENISLKSLSARYYMNAVYLGRLFRKTYGIYFNDYLLQLRVKEAKKLLRQTDLRMYEIAEKVGIQNADYFVTQFEKLEKVTPTAYRNLLLKKE